MLAKNVVSPITASFMFVFKILTEPISILKPGLYIGCNLILFIMNLYCWRGFARACFSVSLEIYLPRRTGGSPVSSYLMVAVAKLDQRPSADYVCTRDPLSFFMNWGIFEFVFIYNLKNAFCSKKLFVVFQIVGVGRSVGFIVFVGSQNYY